MRVNESGIEVATVSRTGASLILGFQKRPRSRVPHERQADGDVSESRYEAAADGD
jgi:hypothetical protein